MTLAGNAGNTRLFNMRIIAISAWVTDITGVSCFSALEAVRSF
jgi:hypothetical protein